MQTNLVASVKRKTFWTAAPIGAAVFFTALRGKL